MTALIIGNYLHENAVRLTSPTTIFFGDFREALLELIASYTSEAPVITEAITSKVAGELTAIISLMDASFSATVTLTTTQSSAISLSHLVPDMADDWLAELAKQLAKRMKDKLSCYGLMPNLGFATIARDKWIQIETEALSACLFTARFRSGEITAQLAIELSPELTLDRHGALPGTESSSLIHV